MARSAEGRAIDEGQALRYAAETQDLAYRSGAYDFVETLDMVPRMAILAGYIVRLNLTRILDIGCGTGLLLEHLPGDVAYAGIDISPTAVEMARRRFAARPNTTFAAASFREWDCPLRPLDGVVWAGIGRTWTRDGRKGQFSDWLDILERAEGWMTDDATILFELVVPHWENLKPLVEERYDYVTGCDLDCLQDDHRAVRAVRVFRRRKGSPA